MAHGNLRPAFLPAAQLTGIVRSMTHAFLSEDWMTAARSIREKYADEVPEVNVSIQINLSVIEVPFGDGQVDAYFDTSTGALQLELGALDEPDATISTDYATAQALFVEQNQAVAMQAFMSGKIKVQGDMMKMMAMQTAIPANDFTEKITQEIANITEPAPAAE
ncbi:MAG: putative sterol carrier protein [Candidatus Azotimanducaceae bacterium]|jgi:putative sterol carrier protein